MKRLAIVLAAAAVLLPSAARAAACSPLTCAASQFSLSDGTLLGFRASVDSAVTVVDLQTGKAKWTLPAGITGDNLLVHQAGLRLVWYDASRGATQVDSAAITARIARRGLAERDTRRRQAAEPWWYDDLHDCLARPASCAIVVPGGDGASMRSAATICS